VKGWPHLRVSALYLVVQLMMNAVIILSDWDSVAFLIFILVSGIVFVGLRFAVEGKRNLIMSKFDNKQI
jgi:hypothetical protein